MQREVQVNRRFFNTITSTQHRQKTKLLPAQLKLLPILLLYAHRSKKSLVELRLITQHPKKIKKIVKLLTPTTTSSTPAARIKWLSRTETKDST